MPSTFTPRLRLTKQAFGENINTWGIIWNASGGSDLIDFAIAGVTTVPLAATNVALTTASGAADESRAAILNCTGILSANVQVIIPNVQKTYVVYNGTTGAFTLGVRTTAGAAVTIVQGTSIVVWCDGNDNVRAVGSTDTAAVNALIAAGIDAHELDPNAHPLATDTQAGFIELATTGEVQTGTDNARAVTPAGLSARTATETRTGVVELATNAEAAAGVDTARAVTPAGLLFAFNALGGITADTFDATAVGDSGKFRIPGPGYDVLIQWGQTPSMASGGAGSFTDAVIFPIAYQAVPAVFATSNARSANSSVFAFIDTQSAAVTVNGFSVGVSHRNNDAFTASAFWVAIGRADP